MLFGILKNKQSKTSMSQTQTVHDHLIKLLVVGDSGVGKTNMILRFCQNKFTSTYLSTIGIDLKVKTILVDGKSLKLQIWDTAGQERFRTITQTYYRGAMGIILVYAVNDRSSFQAIRRWYQQAEEYTGEGALKVIIGNKADSPEREVSQEQGKNLASELGIPFFETSAKRDINIQTSFREMGTLIKQKYFRFQNSINVVTYTGSKLMRRQNQAPKRKRCC